MNPPRTGWLKLDAALDEGWARLGPTGRKGIVSIVDRLIVAGTNFLTLVIVGRAAGVDALGIFALAWTAMLAITALQEAFVHSPYTVRMGRWADERDRARYAGASFALQALLVGAVTAIILAIALGLTLAGGGMGAGAAWALLPAVPAAALREFARRFLFARLDAVSVIVLDATFATLQLVGLGLLMWHEAVTPASALLVMAAASALPALIWMAWRLRGSGLVAAPAPGEVRTALAAHLRFGRWLGAGQMADLAVTHGVTWLLAALVGTTATGIFAACNSIVLAVNPLIFGLGSVLLPHASRKLHERGQAEVGRIVWKVTAVLFVAVGLASLPIAVLGAPVVALLYALEPSGAIVATVALLALANFIGATSFAIDNGLMVIERQDVNFAAAASGLVATLVLGLLLAPLYGVVGMAWGVLAGSTLTTLFQFAAFSRLVTPVPFGPIARLLPGSGA